MQSKFRKIGKLLCAFPNICIQPSRLKEVVAGIDFVTSIEDLESPDKLVFIAQTEAGPIIIVMDDDGVEIRVHSEKTLLVGEEIVRILEEWGAGGGNYLLFNQHDILNLE